MAGSSLWLGFAVLVVASFESVISSKANGPGPWGPDFVFLRAFE